MKELISKESPNSKEKNKEESHPGGSSRTFENLKEKGKSRIYPNHMLGNKYQKTYKEDILEE